MSQNPYTQTPKRFLLVRTDRIGDTILTLPAVTALRKKYPDSFISFLAQPYTVPLVEEYEGIDLLLTYDSEGLHRGWKGVLKLANQLGNLNFDAALLFYPRPELTFAMWFAKIPLRIGTGFRWYSFLMNKRIYEHRKECIKHESEYNLSLLDSLFPNQTKNPEYNFKKWNPESWWVEFNKEQRCTNYAIVHPGSGNSAPNLNADQYILIIRLLLENTNWSVLLTGISKEVNLINELASGFPEERVKKSAGRFSLKELFSVIRNSSLLVTSSTGPLHMANAAGTPLLGFFCPAKPHTPDRWGPYDQQKWVVTPNLNGPETCQLKKCPYGGCLQKLTELEITEIVCNQRLKELNT